MISKVSYRRPLVAMLLLFVMAMSSARADVRAFVGARIWTGNGTPIRDGVLLVEDGKIVAVGARGKVQIPTGAKTTDVRGMVIIPGLVIAETTLGEKGRDDERTLTPQFRAIDGFDFYADYREVLAGGVTTVQISPGSKRLMPGQGAVVKVAGEPNDKSRLLLQSEGVRIVLGDAYKNSPTIYDPPIGAVADDKPLLTASPQLASSLGGAVAGIRATFRAATAYENRAPSDRSTSPALDAISYHLANGKRVRFTAPTAADLRAALRLTREFSLRPVLVDVADAAALTATDEWKSRIEGVVLNPGLRPGRVAAGKQKKPWDTAKKLLDAGYKVAIRPSSDDDLEDTLFLGALFSRGGLSQEQVLRMLTAHPAEMLGVGKRVGSLAKGKDADFVVLTGDPFGTRSRVQTVYVNGELAYSAKAKATTTVIRAAKIYKDSGEVANPGTILIEDGKIRAVGRDVSAPEDATLHQFPDAVIVPGFVDLYTGLGMGAPPTGVNVQTKLGQFLVSDDPAVAAARKGGVTTVLLGPSGNTSGAVVAFKLGDKPRVVRDPVALRFSVSGNLTSQAASLRSTLQQAKAYADKWTKYEADLTAYELKQLKGEGTPEDKPPEKPAVVAGSEPYRPLFAGKIPALVEARRAHEIQLAVEIFRKEMKLRTVILGGDDAFRVAKELAENEVSVAAGPSLVRKVDYERVNLPQVLANHRIPFAFQSEATSGVQTLPLAVLYAVRKGLGTDDALAGLTSSPAKLLSIDDRLGKLAVGADADLVVLSGPPFEASSRVLAVMIDGKWAYQAEENR